MCPCELNSLCIYLLKAFLNITLSSNLAEYLHGFLLSVREVPKTNMVFSQTLLTSNSSEFQRSNVFF